jgi:TonB family protein
VPLNQFKTQVLLLHSDQSALASLSSSFGDLYTVHCATSGSEALTTLGETPINVIISAHRLPGMNGAEALREAKKRSPDTIGFLLTDDEDLDHGAIVGAQEFFQVIRGNVTGDSLKQLVDKATRQVRLMALAESANDTKADVDEPAEHIIMETSENGASIVSDGTSRMRALDPGSSSVTMAAGSQSVDVLVLTEDQEFLATIKASVRGTHHVHHAGTLKQTDETLRQHKIGVAVIDAAMVRLEVEKLTLHLRKTWPRLVSIVAGRRDDGEMLMNMINRGKVYRFLLKPVSPGRARLAVEASIKHHLEAPDTAFQTADRSHAAPAPVITASTQPPASPAPAKSTASAKPQPAIKRAPASSKANTSPKQAPRSAAQLKPKTAVKTAAKPAPKKAIKIPVAKTPLRKAPVGSGGARFDKPILLGVAAIAVVIVAVVLFWVLGGDSDVVNDNAPETLTELTPSITEAEVDFSGFTRSSLETEAIADAALADAEVALLESRIEDADAALQRVAAADPDNPRLPFMTAQLQQMQLRELLTGARTAIKDTRFEDAAVALRNARALGVTDTSEIDAVDEDLSSARSAQRVDETLALANARFEEGDLLAPANDNARYYYGLVLSSAPDNAAARQGLNAVAGKLVLQARTQIDNGDLDAADVLLGHAAAIDATSRELAATTAALLAARDAAALEQRRIADARRQAEAERVAALQRAEADRKAAADAAAQESAQDDPLPQQSADPGDEAAADPEAPEAATDSGEADAAEPGAAEMQPDATSNLTSANSPETAADTADDVDAAMTSAAESQPVAVSSLTRTKYVAPKYPRSAQRRGDTGWVDVLFTMTVEGSVKDVEILNSAPAGVFDNAAARAVEKWTFEPVIENGSAIEKRVAVRMMFALE